MIPFCFFYHPHPVEPPSCFGAPPGLEGFLLHPTHFSIVLVEVEFFFSTQRDQSLSLPALQCPRAFVFGVSLTFTYSMLWLLFAGFPPLWHFSRSLPTFPPLSAVPRLRQPPFFFELCFLNFLAQVELCIGNLAPTWDPPLSSFPNGAYWRLIAVKPVMISFWNPFWSRVFLRWSGSRPSPLLAQTFSFSS